MQAMHPGMMHDMMKSPDGMAMCREMMQPPANNDRNRDNPQKEN